jgi:ribosome-binding protein aMBF1 (putative translation factor)
MAKKTTRDASRIVERMIGNDPELREMIEQETINAEVARMIHDAREAVGLTQAALARLVGTTQSVIARLEDADYEGHSLTMLKRIADALGKRVQIRLVPLGRRRHTQAVA